MISDELARKFQDFREIGIPELAIREGLVHIVPAMVSSIIGARRSGKSYRAFQVAQELIKDKKLSSQKQVCHVDFDNPILSGMNSSQLMLIQEVFLKLNPDFNLKTPLLFILDEIHKVHGWEEYVIDLSRNPNWKVIVTGSSSRMIKDEISTELRGKAVSSVVYPLSFKEFLSFKKFNGSKDSTHGKATVNRYMDEYLKWGAYPGLVELSPQTKETVLREYYDTMILKDIIQRHNVSKPKQCIQLYNYLLSNISRPHTLTSAYTYLKSSGYKTSRDSIGDYIAWAEDAWLLFRVPIFSDSHKEQERNYKKIYAIDWGLAVRNSAVWDGSFTRALENIVYLELRRKFARVCYYLTRTHRQEIDFLVADTTGKPVLAVQVSMYLNNPKTLEREITPLLAAAKYFGIKDCLILTLDEPQSLSREGHTIRIIPISKWLLEN
jgi:predicted AAA+ superfamily ATPase